MSTPTNELSFGVTVNTPLSTVTLKFSDVVVTVKSSIAVLSSEITSERVTFTSVPCVAETLGVVITTGASDSLTTIAIVFSMLANETVNVVLPAFSAFTTPLANEIISSSPIAQFN